MSDSLRPHESQHTRPPYPSPTPGVIWSLAPLPFLKPVWTSGSSRLTYCWSLAWRILSITLLACEMGAIVRWFEHSLALPFFGIGMKTDLFQSCGHLWVFQICWHIECSTFTASSFRIWNPEKRESWGDPKRRHYEGIIMRGCHKETPWGKHHEGMSWEDTMRAAVKGISWGAAMGKPLGTLWGEQDQGRHERIVRRRPREERNIIRESQEGTSWGEAMRRISREQPCGGHEGNHERILWGDIRRVCHEGTLTGTQTAPRRHSHASYFMPLFLLCVALLFTDPRLDKTSTSTQDWITPINLWVVGGLWNLRASRNPWPAPLACGRPLKFLGIPMTRTSSPGAAASAPRPGTLLLT